MSDTREKRCALENLMMIKTMMMMMLMMMLGIRFIMMMTVMNVT